VTARQIEFHVCVIPPREPLRARELAALAEQLGFDRFWVSDQEFGPDPFLLLADLAEHTRIQLGLAVTSPFTRHPAQLARAMATLAHLHPERDWVFGLGTANPQRVLAPLGLTPRNVPRQIRVAIETIRELASGHTVTTADPRLDFVLDGVTLSIDAPPRFALYVGTRGPQMLERAAGEVADGVMVEAQLTAEGIAWARSLLDAGSRNAGRAKFDRPYVSWQLAEVLDDDEPISHHARDFAALLIAATGDETLARMGVPIELAQELRSGQRASADVPAREASKFVAAGTAAQLGEMVDVAATAGADAWTALFTGLPEEAAASMRAFARGLIAKRRSG